MRSWLLTSTYYGCWLPGDSRGSVTSVRDLRPHDPLSVVRIEHDIPGELYEEAMPELEDHAREVMRGPAVFLDRRHAEVLKKQFLETAQCRNWKIQAVAIMFNHFHMVVQVPDDPKPSTILGDFKSYGSRALTKRFGKPVSGTWWTYNGSKRKLKDVQAVADAIFYVVKKQPNPLLVWQSESD